MNLQPTPTAVSPKEGQARGLAPTDTNQRSTPTGISPLATDLLLYAGLLAFQLIALIPGGFLQKGFTPPLVYPCWLILATVNLFRQSELLDEYKTRLIFIPSVLSVLLYGICLINEQTRDLWAFAQPRHFPVLVRILWYQTGLLLIHPLVYPKIWNALSVFSRILFDRGFYGRKVWVIAAIAAMFLWLLHCQNLSPDGFDWLKHSPTPKNWTRYLREPLGTFAFSVFVRSGMALFNLEAYISISVLTILCGIITTLMLRPVFRYAVPEPFSTLALMLLVSSYGYTQIFAGNIEIYALLHLGLAAFIYSAIRYVNGEWPAWKPGFAFGILFCTHLSTGWWLPAFFAVPFLKRATSNSDLNPLSEIAQMIGAFCLFAIPFALFVWLYGYGGDTAALLKHFWGDEVMLTGTDRAMFRKWEAAMTFNVYRDFINEYGCMAIGGMMVLIATLASRQGLKTWTPFCYWTALMTGTYLIYSIVWNPDRQFPADWDLFSGLTIPAILLITQWFSRLSLRREAVFYIYYQAIVFSTLYLLIQLTRNHITIVEWPIDG